MGDDWETEAILSLSSALSKNNKNATTSGTKRQEQSRNYDNLEINRKHSENFRQNLDQSRSEKYKSNNNENFRENKNQERGENSNQNHWRRDEKFRDKGNSTQFSSKCILPSAKEESVTHLSNRHQDRGENSKFNVRKRRSRKNKDNVKENSTVYYSRHYYLKKGETKDRDLGESSRQNNLKKDEPYKSNYQKREDYFNSNKNNNSTTLNSNKTYDSKVKPHENFTSDFKNKGNNFKENSYRVRSPTRSESSQYSNNTRNKYKTDNQSRDNEKFKINCYNKKIAEQKNNSFRVSQYEKSVEDWIESADSQSVDSESKFSFSIKSNSTMNRSESEDQNRLEIDILNLIHNLKRKLHSVDKPNELLNIELECLQKYIKTFTEKWSSEKTLNNLEKNLVGLKIEENVHNIENLKNKTLSSKDLKTLTSSEMEANIPKMEIDTIQSLPTTCFMKPCNTNSNIPKMEIDTIQSLPTTGSESFINTDTGNYKRKRALLHKYISVVDSESEIDIIASDDRSSVKDDISPNIKSKINDNSLFSDADIKSKSNKGYHQSEIKNKISIEMNKVECVSTEKSLNDQLQQEYILPDVVLKSENFPTPVVNQSQFVNNHLLVLFKDTVATLLNNNDKISSEEKKKKKHKHKDIISFAKLSPLNIQYLKSFTCVDIQVDNVLACCNETNSKEDEFLKVQNDLIDLAKSAFTHASLHCYGSRVYGLAVSFSDLDCYLDLSHDGSGYFNGQPYKDQQDAVKKLAKAVRKNKLFKDVIKIKDARVPIVKVFHTSTSINCDISFKNGLSVENTKLLKFYLTIHHSVKWLISAIKLWVQYNNFYHSDCLVGHALNWLVLFYLMQEKIVPPVYMIMNIENSTFVENVNVSFDNYLKTFTPMSKSKSELFINFFRFMFTSNLQSRALCTFSGEFIDKKLFNLDKQQLVEKYPQSDKFKYCNTLDKKAVANITKGDNLCVLDPFMCYNASAAVHSSKFQDLLNLSEHTYDLVSCWNYGDTNSAK